MKTSIIWIFGLAIAGAAGLSAMGAIAKNKAPALAVTLSPMNGFAAEKLASSAIVESTAENHGQFPDRITPTIIQLARTAFLAEPITPAAVVVLALTKRGGTKRKLMNNALLLSRRQPLVSGWMVADSGMRNDISDLLDQYDTILRTNRSAASVVIPVMANALANDKFIKPLANLLAKQPPWAIRFWEQAASSPEALVNAARLRRHLYKLNEPNDTYRDKELINALIAEKQFEPANQLYHLFTDMPSGTPSRNEFAFQSEPEYPPFDWQLISTGEYGAASSKKQLNLSAIKNSGGIFVRKLILHPNGQPRVTIEFDLPIPDDVTFRAQLACAQKGRENDYIKVPIDQKITSIDFQPRDGPCRYFWFELSGRASYDSDGFDVNINSISFR